METKKWLFLLASNLNKGDTLSSLTDRDLFERIIWQNGKEDESLLVSAQLCSLVYSFNFKDTQSNASELKLLACFCDIEVKALYRNVKKLLNRELAQSRGMWCAILPQALADHLARQAFEYFPEDALLETFGPRLPKRLMLSFSHRLGYLHDCKAAVSIVDKWLEPNGWLGEAISRPNDFVMEVLENVAPASPEAVLNVIERVVKEDSSFPSAHNFYSARIIALLRHLAYEPQFFRRSADLMSEFILSANGSWSVDNEPLTSLFQLFLSGTQASDEERASYVERMLQGDDAEKLELGMRMLSAALQVEWSSWEGRFEFGARQRNSKHESETPERSLYWYSRFLKICMRFSLSNSPMAYRAREIIEGRMPDLCRREWMLDTMEQVVAEIQPDTFWVSGWLALVERVHFFPREGHNRDTLVQLCRLEESLRPKDLVDKVRAFALTGDGTILDSLDDCDERDKTILKEYCNVTEKTRKLGATVATGRKVLDTLLPELVSTGGRRLWAFGEGLASGAADRPALWNKLYSAFEKIEPSNQNVNIFCGFLAECARIAPSFYSYKLDELIKDPLLGQYFPILQICMKLDEWGIDRLHAALDYGMADVAYFSNIVYGGRHRAFTDTALATLVEKILKRDGGLVVAIDILWMRCWSKDKYSSIQSARLKVTVEEFVKLLLHIV